MNNLKAKSVLNVALVYWALGGLLVPIIGGVVTGIILIPFAFTSAGSGIINSESALLTIVSGVVMALFIYFGVWYASRFVGRRYVINQPNKIATISVALYVLWFVLHYLSGIPAAIEVVTDIILAALFYLLSRIYLARMMKLQSSTSLQG